MKNNVLVIGNGFDLAHGLPTRYSDFINFVKTDRTISPGATNVYLAEFNSLVENNGFIKYFLHCEKELSGWIDFEKEIGNIIEIFNNLFGMEQSSFLLDGLKFSKCDYLTINTIVKFQFADFMHTQEMIKFDRKYFSNIYGLKKEVIRKKLQNELDELIKAMQLYFLFFIEIYNPEIDFKNIKKIDQINEIEPFYIVSFNYTDTYKIYDIPEENVFHVHGSLKKNNMVLGVNDDDPKNLDFIYFKKYFQRIQKLTGYIDIPNTFFDENSHFREPPVIHFYGHSLDKTDEDIIKSLFLESHKLIVYYLNPEDYAQKVVNLIDIFGKKDATSYIQKGQIEFEEIVNGNLP